MKRVLTWVFRVFVVLLLIPIVVATAAYGYHWSIVAAGPGSLPGAPEPTGRVAKVDTFIGTGGFPWMSALNSVAACVPFGMVRLGPDTMSWVNDLRNLNRSGYHYGDNKIFGFSHNRLVGADSKEGGAFRVFPTTATARRAEKPGQPRTATFSHAVERAFPGYYGVLLEGTNIKAEMTATTRVGIHRYTFPQGETPVLLLDLGSALAERRCTNVQGTLDPATGTITGSMRTFGSFSGRYDGLDVYFAARLSAPPTEYGTLIGATFTPKATTLNEDGQFELHFAPGDGKTPITLALALSYVSIDNAKANLAAEYTGQAFESIVSAGVAAWNGYLDRIEVEGASPKEERIFYTALYRAFIMPTIFNDVNGQYTGFDKKVHLADGFTYYTDFSLWDTFRTVHPLYSLIARPEHNDMMRSLTEMAKAGGALPRWPSGAGYTNCMFGTPADIAVGEAYLKGIRNFDVEAAYAAARHTALIGVPEGSRFGGRQGLQEYLKYQYAPSDLVEESVACTLEYAWCDHALSLWANALGKTDDAAIFAKHAQTYRNVWNPETLFFQARDAEGRFDDENFRPLRLTYTDPDKKYTRAYVEGSAMQWRWGVPFDPEGFVSLWPSPEMFVSELRNYMDGTRKRVGWWNPGGNYWHGNEPYIHAAYLFNSAGRPDLTQNYVRKLLETKYDDTYYGIDGNDDGGTLSSWYVLSALGFYPIAGTTRYEVGIPLFDKAVVHMGEDKKITVTAKDNSPYARYVYNLVINDRPLGATHFDHALLQDGATLEFTLGKDRPDKTPKPTTTTVAP